MPDDAERRPADGRRGRLTAAFVVVLVLGGLLVAQSTSQPPVVPAGFTARGDGARTGIVSTVPVPAPVGVAWRTPVELPPLHSPGTDVLGSTTVDDRELVVVHDPSPDGQRITVHDAADGAIVATTMLPLGSQPFDTEVGDGVLLHRDLTTVTLVDLETGDRRWRVERRLREDSTLTPAGVVGVPAESAGTGLTLLSLEDGSPRWEVALPDTGRVQRLLWAGGRIVVVTQTDDGPLVLGIDPATGARSWAVGGGDLPMLGATFPTAAPVSDGDRLLFAGPDGLVVVDGATGEATTVVAGPNPLGLGLTAVTALADDLLLVSDGASRLVALDLTATGAQVRWDVAPPGDPVFSLDVAAGLVAVRGDGATTLLDAGTGASVARVGPAGGTPRLALTDTGAVAQVTPEGAVELVGLEGVLWRAPTVTVHVPDLATDDGAVAVTTPDGVEVHDVATGARRFAHEAFEPGLVTAGSLTPPSLRAGRVFIAPAVTQPPDRGGLLSLFADTGIVDWARDDDRVVPRGTPVVDRDLVVLPVGSQLLGFDRVSGRRALVVETTIARTDVAAADNWLVAVDAPRDAGDVYVGRRSTRDLVFRAPIRTCAPPVIHEDVVIVVNHLDDIVARTLEDGEQPWGERARGSACRPLTIAGDVLVALVGDDELVAVTLDAGTTAWRLDLPATAAGAPVVAGDQLLVPTVAGEVLAYDVDGTAAPTGPAWRVAVVGTPAGAVAVDGQTLLVLTREGELVALR